MNALSRAFPYIWPYRKKLFLSLIFAILVAVLWGANLSVAYPVIEVVLLQEKSLTEYVDDQIQSAQAETESKSARIDSLEIEIAEADGDKKVELLQYQARKQENLSNAARQLMVMSWIKENLLPYLPDDKFNLLAIILLMLLAATIFKGLCTIVQDVLIGSVVELSVMGIRKDCFRRVLAMDYQSISLQGTPGLMARFTNDINIMSSGLELLGGKVVREPLKAIVCLMSAFYVNWQLTTLSLLLAPPTAFVFHRIGRLLKRASHRSMESMSRIYKILEETFDSAKVVIAFNGAIRHRRRFHREHKNYYSRAIKIVELDALTSPTIEMMGMLAAFMAVLPGAYLVLRDTTSIWGIKLSSTHMTIGELGVLYAFLAGILDPARKLSTTYSRLKRSGAAAERIFGLMDHKSLVRQVAQPKSLPRHSESIVFDKVDFSYASHDDDCLARGLVLDGATLEVRAGEVIAVVGENGSGKSTLVNLLPRFFDPERGTIYIDGVNIREVRLKDLRNQIGVVTQETLLFDETIYENIRYGKPNATRAEVERAAQQAHVLQFVQELPDGFETRVGEKGSRLSGGQRQRIAVARAILRDPSILILDEATSAIDAQSEKLIHEALRGFVKNRTTFLITHSVNSGILEFVTRVVVMERGKVVAAGPHELLIQTSPIYRRLYQVQLEHKTRGVTGPRGIEERSPEIAIEAPASTPHIITLDTIRRAMQEFKAGVQSKSDGPSDSHRPTGSDG